MGWAVWDGSVGRYGMKGGRYDVGALIGMAMMWLA